MYSNEYQINCLRTWNNKQDIREQRLNAALGLGESGEVQNLIKKHCFHGHSLDREKILDELGDLQYYIAVAAYVYGYSLSEVMQYNNEKLAKRYKNGFTVEESINRKE